VPQARNDVTPEEISQILMGEFGEAIEDTLLEGCHPCAKVAARRWVDVATFLRDDSRLRFNLLRSIAAIDMLADDKLACVYDVMRLPTDVPAEMATSTSTFALRVEVDRNSPSIPSVASVWPAADWHEREAFDLMGIDFPGHPDLRRILCCDDWEGFPLRKDYDFPLEYHGIPATTEFELTNPRH
jgi:NADH-quinone oxidoreductase subunit C